MTPSKKGGGELLVEFQGFLKYLVKASADGERVGFAAQSAFAGNPSGLTIKSYSAYRSLQGWVAAPDDFFARGAQVNGVAVTAYSGDMSKALVSGRGAAIAPGAQPESDNFYVRDLATGSYSTITLNAPAAAPPIADLSFIGGSRDFSHVVFEDSNPHSPDAPPFTKNLYEWSGGSVKLVGVLPDGTPAPNGAVAGSNVPDVISGTSFSRFNAVSSDGSHIFFTTPNDNQIYGRIDGEVTRAVSASQKTVPDPGPAGATFWGASADGRRVLFTTTDQLVNDDANPNTDLYEYDTESGRLKRRTIDADVYQVLGMAQDASYVYFMAIGDLVDGVSPFEPNIYVWHDGVIDYVGSWIGITNGVLGEGQTARTSDDGTHFAFVSSSRLTGTETGGLDQVYLYDAIKDRLDCASCRPDGSPADATASLPPGRSVAAPFADPIVYQRSLSNDGSHLFFSTAQQLVEQDTNRSIDAYEYVNGTPRLLSGGQGSGNSYFLDASSSGRDAFFSSREQLVPSDTDNSVDLYDARVGGGFPPPPSPSPPCAGDDCRAAATEFPALPSPSSSVAGRDGNADEGSPSPGFTVRALSRAALKRAARTGVLRIDVRPATRGTLEALAFAQIKRRTIIAGHGSRTVGGGRNATIIVPLQREARMSLAASGVLRLTVRVTQRSVERATVVRGVLRRRVGRSARISKTDRQAARPGRSGQ